MRQEKKNLDKLGCARQNYRTKAKNLTDEDIRLRHKGNAMKIQTKAIFINAAKKLFIDIQRITKRLSKEKR